ncbi:MAG: HAMP domain-containing histidine kinase [Elusimicrobia bacterium]|nr:HAMP domain-containing histidine kinase [Elusimicrobiota bacterium]
MRANNRSGCGSGRTMFCTRRFSRRSRREFYSAISHVFRGPMVGATGYIDYLFKGYSGTLTRDQQLQLVRARESLLSLTSAVNAFLDLVSFDLDLAGLRLKKTDLAAAVADTVVQLRYLAHKRKTRISLVSAEAGIFVRADREWLKTMLQELVTGVLLLSPENSQMTVQLSRAGRRVSLGIYNSSPRDGAKPSPFLFKPFSSEPVKGAPGGRRGGLGLSLAHRIALAHGARVRARSGAAGYIEIVMDMPQA